MEKTVEQKHEDALYLLAHILESHLQQGHNGKYGESSITDKINSIIFAPDKEESKCTMGCDEPLVEEQPAKFVPNYGDKLQTIAWWVHSEKDHVEMRKKIALNVFMDVFDNDRLIKPAVHQFYKEITSGVDHAIPGTDITVKTVVIACLYCKRKLYYPENCLEAKGTLLPFCPDKDCEDNHSNQ